MSQNCRKIVVGISGASGAVYARRLLELLDEAGCQVHVMISDAARQIIARELHIAEPFARTLPVRPNANLTFHDNDDLTSPLASGSVLTDAMVVCPCSSNSLAAIAAGLADNLLRRSAYVTLKQRRRLILLHREAPLTAIDLENMLKLTHAGAIVYPACPSFYTGPKSIDDLVDQLLGRVLDLLGVTHNLPIRYQS